MGVVYVGIVARESGIETDVASVATSVRTMAVDLAVLRQKVDDL